MAEKTVTTPTSMTSRENRLAQRVPLGWTAGPFSALQRLTDEMERMFEDFGLGRRTLSSSRSRVAGAELWAPDIDIFQRNNELVVKADLPGMTKDSVKIHVTDDAITIQGERRSEHEEEREGVYRSERSYGSFYRVVPLPEGAISEQAKASFREGVLEITMPAPPEQVTRGRRLEITGEAKK